VTFPLGLIHDSQPPAVPDLATFAKAPIPTPPVLVEAPQVVWPMADNDQIGDCTEAAKVHVDQAGAAITGEPWTYQGDASLRTEYLGLTGGQDTGLMLPQVLQPWKAGKLAGGANGGYASVNVKNTTLLKQAIWIFGNLYIAVNLPAIAQQQFSPDGSGIWKLTHTEEDYNIEGGHCVVPVGYSHLGVVAVTWGSTVTIEWGWWHEYVTQAYAVVPPAFVEKGGDAKGFDLAAIDAFLPSI
jgi:hypothetical protein